MPSPRLALPAALAALAVLAGVALFHAGALPPGMAFDGGDLREQFIPVRGLVHALLAGEDFPFWQRSIYAGFPLWATSEAALLHPLTWLLRGLEPPRALTVATLVHLALAALGTFGWMRARGRSDSAAAAAAWVVALGGFTTVHLDHWSFSATLAPLPWALWCVELALARGHSPARLLLAALAIALTWYGGAAQIAYFGTLLAAGYVALRVAGDARTRWPVLLVLPAGLLLAAPLLLAGAEFSSLSPRAQGLTLEWAAEYHWTRPSQAALLLFPNAFGPPHDWHGPFFYWEMTGYVGLPALALGLSARPRGVALYFAAVALLVLAVVLGLETPVYGWLFKYLPGFASFRVATRPLFLFNLCAALLLADALDAPARAGLPAHHRLLAPLLSAAALALAAAYIAHRADALGLRADAVRAALPGRLALLAALAAALLVRRFTPRAGAWAVALLVLGDLWLGFARYMPVQTSRALLDRYPALPRLPAGQGRLAPVNLPPNLAALTGAESASGYSQLLVGRVFDLLFVFREGRFGYTHARRADHEYAVQTLRPLGPLFPLMAAPLLVVPQPVQHPALREAPRDGPLHAYALPALPLAYWTDRWEEMDDARFQAEVQGYDPSVRTALAPHPALATLPRPAADAPTPRAVRVLRRTHNTTELEVDAPAAGLLVLLDPHFPGWRAQVDGESAPVLRAHYAFSAVPVPAGARRVTVTYRPSTLGAGLALASLVPASALAWALVRRRRRAGAAGPAGGSAPSR